MKFLNIVMDKMDIRQKRHRFAIKKQRGKMGIA